MPERRDFAAQLLDTISERRQILWRDEICGAELLIEQAHGLVRRALLNWYTFSALEQQCDEREHRQAERRGVEKHRGFETHRVTSSSSANRACATTTSRGMRASSVPCIREPPRLRRRCTLRRTSF